MGWLGAVEIQIAGQGMRSWKTRRKLSDRYYCDLEGSILTRK